ncbi:PorT family protein [Cyclobacterium plantarum]|uniref:PorT family protein n=1 Tax=Cyclobacterium plantarum TaxID=2716263 RepID=A0ABX0H3E6_9BACT|nr:PorT family protein [Cyclobacterium plantarum]NHE56339.1 PorT family protein [Cyclobacterium plantarum]
MKKRVSNMSDKELDDFLKKLSSSPEIPFIPEDWNKMEKMLDQKKVAQPLNGHKWILLGLLLLASLTFTVWMEATYRQIPASPENTLISSSSLLTQIDPNKNIEIKIKDLSFTSAAMSPAREEKVSGNNTAVSGNAPSYPAISDLNLTYVRLPLLAINLDPEAKNKVFEEFNRIWHKFPGLKIQTTAFGPLQGVSPDNLKNNIALAFQVSPDISAVRYTNFLPFGRSIGMSLEYFLSERWSISTGAMHSKKTYQQGPGYWEGYAAHQSLRGDCWILEVPVNIRYYPIMGAIDKWFISTGLSSYFMMKENYRLTYENYGGNPYSEELEITGNNQHVFGIWNIGFGYERRLSRKLAVQVEPYYRLPLVGIGEGNLDLKSTGIFFGIKYYPSNQKLKF